MKNVHDMNAAGELSDEQLESLIAKLQFAMALVNQELTGNRTPWDILVEGLQVMEFGGLTPRDVLDWAQTNPEQRQAQHPKG